MSTEPDGPGRVIDDTDHVPPTAEEDRPGSTPADAAIGGLLEASHGVHPDGVAAAVAEHAARLGLRDVAVYVVDYEQRTLVALPDAQGAPRPPLDIDTTLAGRAFRRDQVVEVSATETDGPAGAPIRLWVPMVDGAERLGVVGVTAGLVDDDMRRRCRNLATVTAAMVVSKSTYGDGIERLRRTRPMQLAAELRWAMLPPLTYTSDFISISGILEPAYEIAGDTFDYAVNEEHVDLAIIDAMGHGLEASRMANLAVIAHRHARRAGAGLQEAFLAMDVAVADQFDTDHFVTGQLARLNLRTGHLHLLNAGHPKPLLLRGGAHLVRVECRTSLPFGLGDVESEVSDIDLEPGDNLLFFTDGVVEARSPEGEEFGTERLADLLVRISAAGEGGAETVRQLSHAILAHHRSALQDDATLLLVRWPGPMSARPGGDAPA